MQSQKYTECQEIQMNMKIKGFFWGDNYFLPSGLHFRSASGYTALQIKHLPI